MPANTSNLTAKMPSDVEKNKTVAMLAYLIFFLPLIVAPDSKFARYHANQGLLLLLSTFGLYFLTGLFGITVLAFFAYLSFLYLGITNARNGQMKPLPIIGTAELIK